MMVELATAKGIAFSAQADGVEVRTTDGVIAINPLEETYLQITCKTEITPRVGTEFHIFELGNASASLREGRLTVLAEKILLVEPAAGHMKAHVVTGLFVAALIAPAGIRAGESLPEQQIVRKVLAPNPMLKAAAAKWEAIKERVPQARAWDDPMVGVDFERTGTTRLGTYSDSEWMVSQTLPIAGKNLSRSRAAEAEARVLAQRTETAAAEQRLKAGEARLQLAHRAVGLRRRLGNRRSLGRSSSRRTRTSRSFGMRCGCSHALISRWAWMETSSGCHRHGINLRRFSISADASGS